MVITFQKPPYNEILIYGGGLCTKMLLVTYIGVFSLQC